MSALPNLSALRLGQGPELDTGGKATTYHGKPVGRRRVSPGRFTTKAVSGREACAISHEAFEAGDPVWVGENGNYYYPWNYYRAARGLGWRDPLTRALVSAGDRTKLAKYLRWLSGHGRSEEHRAAAEAVLDDSLYAAPAAQGAFDDDDNGLLLDFFNDDELPVILPPPQSAILLNPGSTMAHWDAEDYESQELPDATVAAWTPKGAATLADQHADAAEPGRKYLWTSPLANSGKLSVDWYCHESILANSAVPENRRYGDKYGEFTLKMPLADHFKLTKLLLGISSPHWCVVETQDAAGNTLQLPNIQRGSRDALRQTVLRALLMGNHRAPALRPNDVLVDVLSRKLSALDFRVDFSSRMYEDVRIWGLTITISVSLMQTLLNNPGQLEVFAETQRNEPLPLPSTEAGWGNFADQHVSLVESSDPNDVNSDADPFAWPEHWRNAFVRMVQTANNLSMIVQGFDPQPAMQDYRMVSHEPPFAIDDPGARQKAAPEYLILTRPIAYILRPPAWSSISEESATVAPTYRRLLTATMPFWYGIRDDKLGEHQEDYAPDGERPIYRRWSSTQRTVNGRYGRDIPWPSRPRGWGL